MHKENILIEIADKGPISLNQIMANLLDQNGPQGNEICDSIVSLKELVVENKIIQIKGPPGGLDTWAVKP